MERIRVDFDVTLQLLIIYFAFAKCFRKKKKLESDKAVHRLLISKGKSEVILLQARCGPEGAG